MDERIRNIKIAVHNEEESQDVQEKLVELGAIWQNREDYPQYKNARYLFVDFNTKITKEDKLKKIFDNCDYKELYVEDLLAMEKQEDDLLKKIGSVYEREILQTKEKILEEYRNNRRNHSMSETELKKILDKHIGFDNKTRFGGD